MGPGEKLGMSLDTSDTLVALVSLAKLCPNVDHDKNIDLEMIGDDTSNQIQMTFFLLKIALLRTSSNFSSTRF